MSWARSQEWKGRAARVTLCALIAAVPLTAVRAEMAAKVEMTAESITWHPVVEAKEWMLIVAGPGVDLTRRYKGGDTPSISLAPGKGQALPPGLYRYELRGTPPIEARKLERARMARERGEPAEVPELSRAAKSMVQSGHFTVQEGRILVDEKEPGPKVEQTGEVRVDGSLKVRGAKSFVAVDPSDSDRELVYVALEGPEAGTYLRGAARTESGEAVIELPGHFGGVTEADGLTVQLTPIGGWSRLYVADKSPQRLIVRNADGTDVEFNYLIQGVRRGYAGFKVERSSACLAGGTDSEER